MKRTIAPALLFAASIVIALSQTNQPNQVVSDSDIIAVVLGKPVYLKDKYNIDTIICGALREAYIKQNHLEPTEAEVELFVQKYNERARLLFEGAKRQKQLQNAEDEQQINKLTEDLKSPDLSESQRKTMASRLETMQRALKARTKNRASVEPKEVAKPVDPRLDRFARKIAPQSVSYWKYNKSLYDKYGGRVIAMAQGCNPIDACREFLKDQEKAGAFQIIDKKTEALFWRRYTNDAGYKFCSKDEGAKLMETPWWLADKPVGKSDP